MPRFRPSPWNVGPNTSEMKSRGPGMPSC